LLVLPILAALAGAKPVPAQLPVPTLDRLKGHVEVLASPAFAGRRGPDAQKAGTYVADAFRELGLEPLFDGSYTQDLPAEEPGQIYGRNVGARLVGSDPALKDEWIIVSAHFDHLGTRDGVIFPGADDNASGVAMLLEVARAFAKDAVRPRRSVMFVGFDLEEAGLIGSRYFVGHPPVPIARVKLFVTADMIARALGGVCKAHVFVIGTEHAPALRPWIERAAEPLDTLKVGLLGADLLVIDRGDYGPFQRKQVPFLFFSTGENPCYHTPRDVAETLDYPKLESISRMIHGVVREAAMAEAVPTWVAKPDHPLNEALTVREVIRTFLDHRKELKIGPTKAAIMANALKTLDGVADRGAITPTERANMVRVAQFILFTVL